MDKRLAVCLALALVGCGPGENNSPHGQNGREIAMLSAAVETFQERFGVSHLPSRVKLSETGAYPDRDRPGTLDADSVAYLARLWPELPLGPGSRIDWNGDGRAEGDWELEGDECLVYFLGGIPDKAGATPFCLGFSANPRNPAAPGGQRVGPFFEFRSHRLRDLHGRGFLSYLDAYGRRPYAYFSAYGAPNGYGRYGGTDCASLGVWPYAEALDPAPRFLNPRSFQIISAGLDGKFGPGTKDAATVWTSAQAGATPAEGRDDQSNFYDKLLGVPQ